MATYFGVDLDARHIRTEDSDIFTVEQFRTIIENGASQDKFFDMTLMAQRLIKYDYDLDRLEAFYNES